MPSTKARKGSYGLGTNSTATGTFDVELPSGNVALVKKCAPEDLIFSGALDNLDTLTALVGDMHVGRVLKGKPGRAVKEQRSQNAVLAILKDRKKFEALQNLVDAVCVKCIVEPAVSPQPKEGEERKPGIPIEDVDFADKVTVMMAALGDSLGRMGAMEPFRGGPAETVGPLGAIKDLQQAPERANGTGG